MIEQSRWSALNHGVADPIPVPGSRVNEISACVNDAQVVWIKA